VGLKFKSCPLIGSAGFEDGLGCVTLVARVHWKSIDPCALFCIANWPIHLFTSQGVVLGLNE